MRPAAARLPDALLAAAASWAALAPLSTLFDSYSWTGPAVLVSLVVVVTGLLARLVIRRGLLVLLVQLLAGLEAAVLLHGRGHTWFGLPTWETVRAFNNVLFEGRMTLVRYAAPAPTNRGIIVGLTLLTLLFVALIDFCAVTRRSPAVAGIALVAAYLVTATNSGAPLAWYYFAAPAVLWLVMLARTGTGSLRRWATLVARPVEGDRPRDPVDSFADVARNIGIAVLAAAIAVPLIVPHFPTRFLVDGLGRSSNGTSDAGFALSTTLDLKRNLQSPSDKPVLTYRTSDPSPSPLRVAILDEYVGNGNFRTDSTIADRAVSRGTPLTALVPDALPPGLTSILDAVPSDNIERAEWQFRDGELLHPRIALPYGAASLDVDGQESVREYANGQVEVEDTAKRYTVTSVEVVPTTAMLQESRVSDGVFRGWNQETVTPQDLAIDPLATGALSQVLADVVPPGATDIEAAIAIQDYLRSPAFTYSLDLVPVAEGEDRVAANPIVHFLATKQGFCQQFAGTMVMLARQFGIPARIVVGFLPGRLDKGERTVLASDAHAWPELYFEPLGWLRFEPTPASRSGAVPAYAREGNGTSSATASSSTTASASSTTRRAQPGVDVPTPQGQTSLDRPIWQRVGDIPRAAWVVLALVLGIIGSLVLPVTALLIRRRRFAAAADDAAMVELRWQEMIRRIGDLGVRTPDALTPRQIQGHLTERALLSREPAAALGRVVTAVELARYAGPGTSFADPAKDVDAVLEAVDSSRSLVPRLRARLLPSSATAALGRSGRRIADLPRAAWEPVRDSVADLVRRRR
ncbi:transglutaminaseTgpA domain-containing protein [Nostocoides vanveenii]|uniref:DUF3488 and transglutaminase-like domain-containing protein n=1 Tax=Nostocoides vanveenii TaxID=330835 RepID=A0ABP4WW78_9MICO